MSRELTNRSRNKGTARLHFANGYFHPEASPAVTVGHVITALDEQGRMGWAAGGGGGGGPDVWQYVNDISSLPLTLAPNLDPTIPNIGSSNFIAPYPFQSVETNGIFMMFDGFKGAFRAGNTAGEWQDALRGSFSVALGDRCQSTGLVSMAYGQENVCLGDYSSILGGSTNYIDTFNTYSSVLGSQGCSVLFAGSAPGRNVISESLNSSISTSTLSAIHNSTTGCSVDRCIRSSVSYAESSSVSAGAGAQAAYCHVSGRNNVISGIFGSEHSNILNGEINNITASVLSCDYNTILNGSNNSLLNSLRGLIHGDSNTIDDCQSFSSLSSTLCTLSTCTFVSVESSSTVTVDTTNYASSLSSLEVIIDTGTNVSAIATLSASILACKTSVLLASEISTITNSSVCLISGATTCQITDSSLSSILGGSDCSVSGDTEGTNRCIILNGISNSIKNCQNATVLGGENVALGNDTEPLLGFALAFGGDISLTAGSNKSILLGYNLKVTTSGPQLADNNILIGSQIEVGTTAPGDGTKNVIAFSDGVGGVFNVEEDDSFNVSTGKGGVILETTGSVHVYDTNGTGIPVATSTLNPAPDAIMEVTSTERGFLPPRMTAAQRGVLPAVTAGLIVYQTDGAPNNGLYVYDGASWRRLLW